MKPDLLICWIKHCDYPVFRMFLRRHRDFFGKIIIYWSEHFREYYFDKFIENDLKDLNITFLPSIEYKYGVEDWRNVATNHMLKFSNSQWVCSVEQDFFCNQWDKLLKETREAFDSSDLIGWWQENNKYIHPSYWFIKREVLEKTKKDFSAHGKHDHFGWISEEVLDMGIGNITAIQDFGLKDFTDFFHLGGVNQNYLEGLKDNYVFHRPEIFSVYNHFSQLIPVNQSLEFMGLCQKIEQKLPVIKDLCEKWDTFFK